MAPTTLSLAVGAIAVICGIFVVVNNHGVTPPHIPPGSPTALYPPWPIVKVAMALNDALRAAATATTPPPAQVIQLATGYWKSEVLYALTKNGVFDVVGESESSLTCLDVANKVGLLERPVCEYMRAGALLGLFRTETKYSDSSSSAQSHIYYSLSPSGELLQSNVPGSLRDFTLMINEETKDAWRAAGTKTVQSGVSGFKEAFGNEWWGWHNEHPVQEAQFDRSMTSMGFSATGAALVDWEPAPGVFCDVGGGQGTSLQLFLAHYPELRGIVLDQPSVAQRATEYLTSHGQADRAHGVGGSFFEPFPKELEQCDTFFLKFILHDWGDDECISILKNIKAVAKPGAKVVVMEQVLDTTKLAGLETPKALMSVNMLASNKFGARERTAAEYKELFAAAGMDGNMNVIPTRDIYALVEAEV